MSALRGRVLARISMRVLTLSADGGELLAAESPLKRRFIEYGTLVERFDVVYPDTTDRVTHLSDRVTLYGIRTRSKVEYFFRLWFRLRALKSQHRYDVLSTSDPYFLARLALWFRRFTPVGVEVQVHGFEKWYGIRPWLARWNLRRADQVRAVNERLAKTLASTCGVSRSRISVFPIFIDPTRFTKVAHERGPDTHIPFTFITVSRLVPVKRIEKQLEALAQVRQQHDAQLLIVGDGPTRSALEALANTLNIRSNVTFFGAQQDIPSFLGRSDVFLLTSETEGYGIAPIEAACAGLPIIMTDVGCANEVLRDHVHGFILPVNHPPKMLANAMQQLIENADLRAKFSVNALKVAESLPLKTSILAKYLNSWERARRA